MKNRIKGVLIGDVEKAIYHPLQIVEQEILNILKDDVDITITEDYKVLSEGLLSHDLCISYTDCWNETINDEQAAGLISFVAGGGGLVVIHNGISMGNRYELAQIIGGKFNGHPPSKNLDFKIRDSSHYITNGVGNFQMEEEPYRFDFDTFTDHEIILEYKDGDDVFPAAWAHKFGMGRVVYLMPGHNKEAFLYESYRKIITRSAIWAAPTCK